MLSLADAQKRFSVIQQSKIAENRVSKTAATLPVSAGMIPPAFANPQQLTSTSMLSLQRTVGNQALVHLLRQPHEQEAKHSSPLRVGPANDRFEQEATRISEQVTHSSQSTVQRMTTSTQIEPQGGAVDDVLASRIRHAKGGGRLAPEAVQRMMKQKIGADFSKVRVHNNPVADAITGAMSAKAATHGKDIFLARNQSPHDVQLMAHELTHTIQQGAVDQVQLARDNSAKLEDRMAFISLWRQIESDVGDSRNEQEIYQAFVEHSRAMMQVKQFYPAILQMQDGIDSMIADYVDGYTLEQMADSAGF